MSLWDFLKRNKKDIFQEYADNMQPLQPVAGANSAGYLPDGGFAQTLPTVQMNEDGSSYVAPTPTKKQGGFRTKLADLLLGNSAAPTDNAKMQDGVINVTVSENPRVGGFIPDFTSGMRENYTTGFAAPNLFDDTTSDGRNKGFAYRLGEGLGSVGRFLESAPGRALLTAGAVGLAGGNGADMLAYGIQGGALNNRLRTQDRMYRDEMLRNAYNSLKNNPEFNTLSDAEQQTIYNQLLTNPDGTMKNYNTMTDAEKQKFNSDLRDAYANRLYQNQQEQLNNVVNNINGMRGYVTNDVYNNFVRAQQLRDNADYRNMMANLQMQNNQALQDFRKDQAEYQRHKDIADRQDRALTRQLTARGQDLNYGLGMARIAADRENKYNKQSAKMRDAQSTLNQIDLIRDMVQKNPNATGLGKGMITGDLLNRFDNNPNNIQTRTAIDALRTKIRHDLTGAQFSPKEAREYEKFLPNVRDNAQIINAKLDALEKRYYADFGVSLTGGYKPSNKGGRSF